MRAMSDLISDLRKIADDLEAGRPVRRIERDHIFEPIPDPSDEYRMIKGDETVEFKIRFIGNSWKRADS